MNAGDLNRRITIQRRVANEVKGENKYTFADFATVHANMRPLRGREFFAAAQYQAELTTKFTIRYRTDVDETMRISYRGEFFDIGAPPIDVGGQHVWLELLAKAGTGDAHHG